MRVKGLLLSLAILAVGLYVAQPAVQAGAAPQAGATSIAYAVPETSGGEFWTPERLAAAKPFPMPLVSGEPAMVQVDRTAVAGAGGEIGAGAAPTITRAPETLIRLWDPRSVFAQEAPDVDPNDHGTGGAYYTSSRVATYGSTQYKKYPYTTVGKLYFNIGTSLYVCSASSLRPRVLLTAGHCVHSGNGSTTGWYTNWVFYPSLNGTIAPFGKWKPTIVWVTGTWFSGGGGVPNAADYAMMEMKDSILRVKMGNKLGYLGYHTLALSPNHATLVGYPQSFDNGNIMHQTTSESAFGPYTNCYEYGTNHTGGSSGGPWVENMGQSAVGEPSGLFPSRNLVIGITSYGYTDAAVKLQGSSTPDSRFTDMLTLVCNHKVGNC